MKSVKYGCGHSEEVEDDAGVAMVVGLCSRCLSVKSTADLFVGYPCGYRTQSGQRIAAITIIDNDDITVATNHATGLAYREWKVKRGDFHQKGNLFIADPYGTIK